MIRKTVLYVAGTACVATLAFVSLQAADAPPAPSEATPPAKPGEGPKRTFHKPPFDKGDWGRGKDGRFSHRGPGGFHRGPDRGHGRGFDRGGGGPDTLRALNLTDEQKAKVKEVMEGDKEKIMAILKEQREKIEAVRAESAKAIRPILTEDQQAVYDDAQKLRDASQKLREDIRKLHADKAEKKP